VKTAIRSLLFAGCCICGLASAAGNTCPSDVPPGTAPIGVLSFADEFDTLDLARWSTTFPWGGRNLAGEPGGSGELQEYVERGYRNLNLNPFAISAGGCDVPGVDGPTPTTVAAPKAVPAGGPDGAGLHCQAKHGRGGILSIRADAVTASQAARLDGRRYTSGLLTTFRSFSQRYGYFEMRARLPLGRGLWPAFWLLPIDKSWPPEIDVMEVLGDRPTTLYATLHRRTGAAKDAPVGFEIAVADMTTAFHRYGVLWTPRFLAWYFDGRLVAHTETPAGLNMPMYLLVNLAVGGKWAGSPDETTRFPATMLIDYIRAYELPSAPDESQACRRR
jgi:hypothetical protein